MANVPNKVNIPLDCVWSDKEFKHLVMILGYATGAMDENANSETKALYSDCAQMCESFLKKYNAIK